MLLLLMFHSVKALAQEPSAWQVPDARSYPFVHKTENKLSNPEQLQLFFEKLYRVKKEKKGVVRVVHIGDSHIQADMMTAILRQGFQQEFGHAGRGIVFPYQVARSNGPNDYRSSSSDSWKGNRLAHPEIPIETGISGFGIHAASAEARFSFTLDSDTVDGIGFDKVRLFPGLDSACYSLTYNGAQSVTHCSRSSNDSFGILVNLPEQTQAITVSKTYSSVDSFDFYGMSLERRQHPGVIYHTIGVNGAQYYQYNQTPLFWRHLPALRADCYIISLGTNEAQDQRLNADSLRLAIAAMVDQLRTSRPNAAIIITTPPGSYYRQRKPNPTLPLVRQTLKTFTEEHKYSCWDLFAVSGGLQGVVTMARSGVLRPDKVHFSREGYELQGSLLLEALAHAWNEWLTARTGDR